MGPEKRQRLTGCGDAWVYRWEEQASVCSLASSSAGETQGTETGYPESYEGSYLVSAEQWGREQYEETWRSAGSAAQRRQKKM